MSFSKNIEWNKLDNAAKIFPSTSNSRDTKVFRCACELHEQIDAEILQQALNIVVENFPIFCSVLKRGVFWYYLERSDIRPTVLPEYKFPCAELYDRNRRGLLFEVTWYKNRINLEIFHALSDGTGALQFIKHLVCKYLELKHPDQVGDVIGELDYDASESDQSEDSFNKYYDPHEKTEKDQQRTAYQMRGARLPENQQRVIEGVMPVRQTLDAAKRHATTLTEYLVALFIYSYGKDMSILGRRKPVCIDVPINLRNYFESATARNFFGVMNIKYQFGKEDPDLSDILQHVHRSFERELKKDKIMQRIKKYSQIEHNFIARAVPLFLKDWVLNLANKIVRRGVTGSLSNVGRISMPKSTVPFIHRFDLMTGTDKIQICVCSFEQLLTISFTSGFVSTNIQKTFFRKLTKQGIEVEILTNPIDE